MTGTPRLTQTVGDLGFTMQFGKKESGNQLLSAETLQPLAQQLYPRVG